MAEYGREQRNQLSRAIANSRAGTRQLKEFVDSRPFRILQPNTSYAPFSKMLIQKKAYDDNLPIKYASCSENAIIIDNPTKQEKTVIDDPYSRYYESENEFRKHVGGEPVPCGLIKHLALWYRIPFLGSKFFVLGEQHDHLSYTSIVKESNQYLPVLGEKGVIPVNSSTTTPFVYSEMIGNAPAYSMESILSKTYLALSKLKDEINRIPSKDKYKHKSPEKWINHVESSKVDVVRKQGKDYCAPYYADGEKKYQIDDGSTVAEKSYSGLDAIKNVMKLCLEEIEKVPKSESNFEPLPKLKKIMKKMLGLWNLTFIWQNQIEEAKSYCKQCAEEELKNAKLERVPIYEDGDSGNANSMRESYMLNAIKEASQSRFLLAGIGNIHAKHLKSQLEDEGIKIILLEEFMTTDYTRDAFDSSHSSIPDSTTRP